MLHKTFSLCRQSTKKHLCAYGTILHNMALDKTKQLVISQYSLLLDHHLGPQSFTTAWKSFGFIPQCSALKDPN